MVKYARFFSLWFGIAIIFGCIEKTFAEDISLTATIDRNSLTLNDRLQLTLTIHGTQDTSPPSFPSIDGFTLLFGPKIQRRQILSTALFPSVKGIRMCCSQPQKASLQSGRLRLNTKGKVYSSSPVTVEVVGAAPSSGSQAPDIGKLVFVELRTDKNEAYIYEQVVLSFRFYFQKGLPVADLDYGGARHKNFMEEKLGDQRQYEEIRDGIVYNVLELRTALFPMVSGELYDFTGEIKVQFNYSTAERTTGFAV